MKKINPFETNNEILKSLDKRGLVEYIMSMKKYLIDGKTGLNTRNTMQYYIDEIKDSSTPTTIAYYDMNKLKKANDEYGHAIGDIYIAIVTNLIKLTQDKNDKAIRLGGDEFLAFYNNKNNTANKKISMLHNISNYINESISPEEINEKIQETFNIKINIDSLKNINNYVNIMKSAYAEKGDTFDISFATGVCEYSKNKDISEQISIAEKRMYEDKNKIKDNEDAIIKTERCPQNNKKVKISRDKQGNIFAIQLDENDKAIIETLRLYTKPKYFKKTSSENSVQRQDVSTDIKNKSVIYDAIINGSESHNVFQYMYESELSELAELITNDITLDPITGFYKADALKYHIHNEEFKNKNFMMLDVNHLKLFNDANGHSTGDRLLKSTADLLKSVFNDKAKLFRIGGDEIGIIYEDDNEVIYNKENGEGLLKDTIKEFNERTEQEFEISVSCGATKYDPEKYKTPEECLDDADLIMYKNKELEKMKNDVNVIIDKNNNILGISDTGSREIIECAEFSINSEYDYTELQQ